MTTTGDLASPGLEYARRLQRVLDHIDAHLDDRLDLPTLAAVAHFSPFHFHRVFSAWTGETVGDHVRRRRLEAAAVALGRRPEQSVLHIALEVGFGSAEAFARAFKARFGSTPSAWRVRDRTVASVVASARGDPDADRKFDQAVRRGSDHDPVMDVTLVNFPEASLACFRHVGPYGAPIADFWRRQVAPFLRRHGLDDAVRYGLSWDDPTITPALHCRYDAAVEIGARSIQLDPPARAVRLESGLCSVVRYEGTASEIGAAWADLFRAWLPASGWQAADRPCFERYDGRRASADDAFVYDLCLPVVRL